MLNNLNSERIMEAREIYHVLKSIVEPIHAHSDQMVAIAKWIEAEFEYKSQKQANGADQSASNCNIPLVSGSLPTLQELKAKSYELYPRVAGDASESYRNSVQRNNWIQGAQYVRKLVGNYR